MSDLQLARPALRPTCSTLVDYHRSQQARQLKGQFQHAKINQLQLLSYNAEQNDRLFVNAYYARLKQALTEPTLRPAIRRYLWTIRTMGGPGRATPADPLAARPRIALGVSVA